MKVLLYLSICFALLACNAQNNSDLEQNPKSWAETVMAIPDDKATPDELKVKNAMLGVIRESIAVEDNQLVLTVDKKYFKSCGVPEAYYDLLEAEFKETNKALVKMISEYNIDLEKVVDEYKVNLTKHLQQLESKE